MRVDPFQVSDEFKPKEARLYVDAAVAFLNRGIEEKDQFDVFDVIDAFFTVYDREPFLIHYSLARGTDPTGPVLVVTDSGAEMDARASDALLEKVHLHLYGAVAFA